MTTPWTVLLAVAVGAALGGLYFEGLWATTRRLGTARRPAPLLLVSFFLRLVLLMGGLALVATTGWWHLATATVGVVGARTLSVRAHAPGRSYHGEERESRWS